MTKLDWRKEPEPDPARVQREPGLVSRVDPQLIEHSGVRPRRVTAPPPTRGKIARWSFDEAIKAVPNYRKTISRRIRFVELAGKTDCNGFIHDTAIAILEHVEKTGDCSAALRLATAIPSPRRRELLARWFSRYSPIEVDLKKKRSRLLKPGWGRFRPFDLQAARRVAFYELR
jgi:hypothetical protein